MCVIWKPLERGGIGPSCTTEGEKSILDHLLYLCLTQNSMFGLWDPAVKILLLRWRYSPGWVLASFTIRLQASRSLALSLHSFIPIFLRSVDTSSSHLIYGLTLRLVGYSFPYNILFGIAVCLILSIWPSHRIIWHLINLKMFSPLIIASNSSFRRILPAVKISCRNLQKMM